MPTNPASSNPFATDTLVPDAFHSAVLQRMDERQTVDTVAEERPDRARIEAWHRHLLAEADTTVAPIRYYPWHEPRLSTSLVDSIAADTIAPHILTPEQSLQLAEQHRSDSIAAVRAMSEEAAGRNAGLAAQPIHATFDGLDAISALVAGLLVLAGLCSGSIRRALRSYRTQLLSVRRRQNVFEDSHKVPVRASVILVLIMIVFGGLAMYCATPFSAAPSVAGAAAAMGLAAVYYAFLFCAYNVVGYAFTSPRGRNMWVSGFVATQAITGLLLIVPVLLLLLSTLYHAQLLVVCAVIFLGGKLIFIIKGFRIFYNNFRSILYFILYLCTLEVIPLIVLYVALTYIEQVIAA